MRSPRAIFVSPNNRSERSPSRDRRLDGGSTLCQSHNDQPAISPSPLLGKDRPSDSTSRRARGPRAPSRGQGIDSPTLVVCSIWSIHGRRQVRRPVRRREPSSGKLKALFASPMTRFQANALALKFQITVESVTMTQVGSPGLFRRTRDSTVISRMRSRHYGKDRTRCGANHTR